MYKFLRGASHSQQQMFYQRNHRNLLFFCHPFRTYHSMKTNNNAKCCLLLDNMANKKCILIHSREFRLRHKTSSTAATSDNKKEESAKKMEMDPQELLSKFVYEIPDNHKPSADGKRNLGALHDDLNQVMAKFNKEHAKSGYKIEFADDGVQTIQLYFDKKLNEFDLKEQKIIAKKFRKIMAPPIFTLIFDFIFMLYLIWIFRPRGNMKPEHAQIVAQPPITFEQFLNEYLPSGEIDIIYYYPEQNLLVVLLRPNALIKGEPFIAPGLHVHLDESFRKMPMALTQRIHTEEGLIGLRDSIPIVTGQLDLSSSYKIRYYLGTFSLMILIYVLLIPLVVLGFLKRRFRVVPINSKGTMSKRRNKID